MSEFSIVLTFVGVLTVFILREHNPHGTYTKSNSVLSILTNIV